jgi:hypothetical protein
LTDSEPPPPFAGAAATAVVLAAELFAVTKSAEVVLMLTLDF